MESVWQSTTNMKDFSVLSGNVSTDILIIGGGLAGVLCAYMLEQEGADYLLVEADKICSGVTAYTTAKLTLQHGIIYDKLIREFGMDKAKMYLRANQEALEKYKRLCKNIECGFTEKDNYVYSRTSKSKIEKESAALSSLGVNAKIVTNIPVPIDIAGAVKVENQAQFNPLQFVAAISSNLNIYEHTKVRELIGTTATTENARITAKRIIVATHFPFINKHGSYFIKMYQQRSYVIALENVPQIGGMYVDESDKGHSFRNYGNLLLIGGGGHRTGKAGGGFKELREFAKLNYPNVVEKHHWATQDCITLDGAPYIGNYSKNTENLYVATGFNKWGMTNSMVAATILTNMLQGRSTIYESVFDPGRSILHPKLLSNAAEATISMLTPSTKRCPHLGCALKWNKEEHTWDCPCHGSRFTEDGNLIENPSTADLKI